jgi:diguanylate cyclase (GGDEF)-like protein
LSRELVRARRTGTALALAFIDVDDLKQVNDAYGHAAGDRLLRVVANTVRARLRAYDVIVRYGGDELICALPGLTALEATNRFAEIASALTDVNDLYSVTVGIAAAESDDTIEDVIARADARLLEIRRSRRSDANSTS